ncbi:hypothetical protein OH786_10490 [Streptomyces atratus]|uniref:Uncharacterized protein n=1 Tax=Streptomyces atratus TaxID=1893 RepID=A0A1K1UQB1_STRAR|nr:hypothetical protein [Streptomyces atratus]SFX15018.1 hypothetical protein SAMN02787144_1001678 [Streptomyces atratus]
MKAAVDELRQHVADSDGRLAGPISTVQIDDILMVRVPLAGSGTDEVSNAALKTLREDTLPATLGKVEDIDYAVGGRTAFGPSDTDSRTPTDQPAPTASNSPATPGRSPSTSPRPPTQTPKPTPSSTAEPDDLTEADDLAEAGRV